MEEEREVMCPYNNSHMVKYTRLYNHIMKCEKQHPNSNLKRCRFNVTHRVPESALADHLRSCEDAAISRPRVNDSVDYFKTKSIQLENKNEEEDDISSNSWSNQENDDEEEVPSGLDSSSIAVPTEPLNKKIGHWLEQSDMLSIKELSKYDPLANLSNDAGYSELEDFSTEQCLEIKVGNDIMSSHCDSGNRKKTIECDPDFDAQSVVSMATIATVDDADDMASVVPDYSNLLDDVTVPDITSLGLGTWNDYNFMAKPVVKEVSSTAPESRKSCPNESVSAIVRPLQKLGGSNDELKNEAAFSKKSFCSDRILVKERYMKKVKELEAKKQSLPKTDPVVRIDEEPVSTNASSKVPKYDNELKNTAVLDEKSLCSDTPSAILELSKDAKKLGLPNQDPVICTNEKPIRSTSASSQVPNVGQESKYDEELKTVFNKKTFCSDKISVRERIRKMVQESNAKKQSLPNNDSVACIDEEPIRSTNASSQVPKVGQESKCDDELKTVFSKKTFCSDKVSVRERIRKMVEESNAKKQSLPNKDSVACIDEEPIQIENLSSQVPKVEQESKNDDELKNEAVFNKKSFCSDKISVRERIRKMVEESNAKKQSLPNKDSVACIDEEPVQITNISSEVPKVCQESKYADESKTDAVFNKKSRLSDGISVKERILKMVKESDAKKKCMQKDSIQYCNNGSKKESTMLARLPITLEEKIDVDNSVLKNVNGELASKGSSFRVADKTEDNLAKELSKQTPTKSESLNLNQSGSISRKQLLLEKLRSLDAKKRSESVSTSSGTPSTVAGVSISSPQSQVQPQPNLSLGQTATHKETVSQQNGKTSEATPRRLPSHDAQPLHLSRGSHKPGQIQAATLKSPVGETREGATERIEKLGMDFFDSCNTPHTSLVPGGYSEGFDGAEDDAISSVSCSRFAHGKMVNYLGGNPGAKGLTNEQLKTFESMHENGDSNLDANNSHLANKPLLSKFLTSLAPDYDADSSDSKLGTQSQINSDGSSIPMKYRKYPPIIPRPWHRTNKTFSDDEEDIDTLTCECRKCINNRKLAVGL